MSTKSHSTYEHFGDEPFIWQSDAFLLKTKLTKNQKETKLIIRPYNLGV